MAEPRTVLQQCPLLALPPRIRLRIYKLVFATERDRPVWVWASRVSRSVDKLRLRGALCTGVSETSSPIRPHMESDQLLMDEIKFPSMATRELFRTDSLIKFYVTQPGECVVTPGQGRPPVHMAITRTCRQVHHETHFLPYRFTTFRFQSTFGLAYFMRTVSSACGSSLRSLSFVCTKGEPRSLLPRHLSLIASD